MSDLYALTVFYRLRLGDLPANVDPILRWEIHLPFPPVAGLTIRDPQSNDFVDLCEVFWDHGAKEFFAWTHANLGMRACTPAQAALAIKTLLDLGPWRLARSQARTMDPDILAELRKLSVDNTEHASDNAE